MSAPVKSPQQRTYPFSLRLSEAERDQLRRAAGPSQSVATYVRRQLFGETIARSKPRRQVSPASIDKAMIAQAMGRLGQSGLAENLRLLAHATKSGTLEATPDVLEALFQACADVRAMREQLTTALGFKPTPNPKP